MKQVITISLLVISIPIFAQKIDANYESQKKKIIKMEFFSPLTGNTTLGFESYVKDWVSWEAKAGIIGLGTDNGNTNPSGFLFKGGPKFKLNPDFITEDLKGSHLLSGKYIRPEIVFATYNEWIEEFNGFETSRYRKNFTSIGFLITYGRQYVLADIMTLDYHIGLGYGSNSSNEGRYYFAYSVGDRSIPIAISAGFTIGVLIK